MEVICTERSVQGPVRPNNEDLTAFFQPDSLDDRRTRGIVAILADGVGGEERGEIASRLAVEAALQAFREAAPETAPAKLLGQMFNAANLAVYDAAHHGPHKGKGGMSTTLAVSLFRHDEVAVAHVGDTRIYHLRGETLTRLTTDHSYVSLEVKLGLVSERDAMTSRLRSVLTRSVGHDPVCRVTYGSQSLAAGRPHHPMHGRPVRQRDRRRNPRDRQPPRARRKRATGSSPWPNAAGRTTTSACRSSACRASRWSTTIAARRSIIPCRTWRRPATTSPPGQVLDDRYEISEVISRSGMASIFKATDRADGRTVALKVPHMQFESDIGSYQRFEREEAIGLSLDHPSILKILPGPEHKSRPYIVMEFLEGQTLAEVLGGVASAAGKGRRGHRQPGLRGAGIPARAQGHPPRPQAAEHHALRGRQRAPDGLRHRQGRTRAAADVGGLLADAGHARLHGARSR